MIQKRINGFWHQSNLILLSKIGLVYFLVISLDLGEGSFLGEILLGWCFVEVRFGILTISSSQARQINWKLRSTHTVLIIAEHYNKVSDRLLLFFILGYCDDIAASAPVAVQIISHAILRMMEL